MAHVTAQIAVSITTNEGTWAGRKVSGWETFQIVVKGEPVTKHRSWTLWFESPVTIAKGDVIEFSGELGTKAGTYEKDGNTYKTVEHSVNNPRWTTIHKAEPKDQATGIVITDGDNQPF